MVREGGREKNLGRQKVVKKGRPLMSVTAAVFHRETSPLKLDAPSNICLAIKRQGRARRCSDAIPPRAAGREAAVQGRRKMRDMENVVAAMIYGRGSMEGK